MKRIRFTPALVAGLLVALCFGIALWLRAYLPHDKVFTDGLIKFAGNDSYYHMRLVDNLLRHLFHPMTFDPFSYYPHGMHVPWPPFFDWILAGTIWLAGLGSPSQHLVDVIGVYYPAILGALTVIPIYFIGKELFNRWVGVMAAGLVAIIPSEFLSRSLLGYTDHHVAEVLFTSLTVLFLILAIKTSGKRLLNFSHLLHRDWAVARRPLIYSLLAGIFLGIYLSTWVGGLFFVFLFFVYFVVQSIVDHLKGVSTDYICIIGAILFLVAAIISFPFVSKTYVNRLFFPSFAIAAFTLMALVILSRLMNKRKLAPFYYPLAVIVLGLVLVAFVYLVDPSFLKSMLNRLEIFTPTGAALTITEVRPLLFQGSNFTFSVAWNTLTTGFFISFISLGILIYLTIKRGDAGKTLLLVWSLVTLLATLGQRRFSYYYTVNVALLSAYLSWQVLSFCGFKDMAESAGATEEIKQPKTKSKKKRKGSSRFPSSQLSMALSAIVVFFAVFYPNIRPAINLSRAEPLIASDAWYTALYWLRDNTPDPFGDSSYYYAEYASPGQNHDYDYPQSAYSVMAWWDYGHEITRLAHRIPVSNPLQQGASIASDYFISQDATSASKIMDALNSKYVVIDYGTAYSKFVSVVGWSDKNIQDFYEVYYMLVDGKLTQVIFFYPEYYYSTAVRLYNFDGKAVTPEKSYVIAYQDKVDSKGVHYKEITSSLYFSTYDAAKAYVAKQTSGNYRIGGLNPFISPVPLEKLSQYQLIYSSNAVASWGDVKNIPAIKIFEYQK
jgi:oligosaccharyl transferase (archaeosortase A-associated)